MNLHRCWPHEWKRAISTWGIAIPSGVLCLEYFWQFRSGLQIALAFVHFVLRVLHLAMWYCSVLKKVIYVGVFHPAESVCTSQLQRRRATYSRIPFFEPLGEKRVGLNYREVGKIQGKVTVLNWGRESILAWIIERFVTPRVWEI